MNPVDNPAPPVSNHGIVFVGGLYPPRDKAWVNILLKRMVWAQV